MNDLRIAVAFTPAAVGNVTDNLDRVRRWAKTAKSNGAALICFPEMNVTGYYNHQEIREVAEPIPGPISRRRYKISMTAKIPTKIKRAESDQANPRASRARIKSSA